MLSPFTETQIWKKSSSRMKDFGDEEVLSRQLGGCHLNDALMLFFFFLARFKMVGWTKEHMHVMKAQVFFSRLGSCYGERTKKKRSGLLPASLRSFVLNVLQRLTRWSIYRPSLGRVCRRKALAGERGRQRKLSSELSP